MFRLLGCLVVVAVFAGCGPEMDRCESDLDCLETQYCVSRICVERSVKPDAGTDAGVVDAGTPDAGSTQPTPDAGTTTDAGVRDAGVEPACELHDTRACCGGRGEQTCVQSDGGLAWDECDATKTSESCNGIDDDCNGVIDDGVTVSEDAGVSPDAGCFVGVGACARAGALSCSMSSLVCDATPGQPGAESCNGADDDCDGTVDDDVTCAIPGQTCWSGACTCGMNKEVCGGICQSVGGSCTNGVGACARPGTMACADGAVSCNAVAAQPSTESCNNIDDDCDGQTDEGSAICAVTGQSCVSGACACPAGQVACGGSCQTVGAECFVGVGACRRDGVMACTSAGTVSCNVVAGTPTAEICDSVDNDCDGETDEQLRLACVPDSDNDLFANASGQTPSQQCRDQSRAAAGFCPAGFVAPTSNNGPDCAPQDSSRFRELYVSPDADNDARCTTAGTLTCIGNAAPAGHRLSTTCVATSDCAPTDNSKYRMEPLRDDVDGDSYCVNAAVNTCIGDNAPAGKRISYLCNGNSDCRDTNPRATTSCTSFVSTSSFIKRCGGGYAQSDSIVVSWTCPAGFTGTSGTPVYLGHTAPTGGGAPIGTSVSGGFFGDLNSATTVTATCTTAFTDDVWRIDVRCDAN